MAVDGDDGDNGVFIYRATSGSLKQLFWMSFAFICFALSHPILFYLQAWMVAVTAMMIEHYLMDRLNRCKTARSRENPCSNAKDE
jgi:hypothetical protein